MAAKIAEAKQLGVTAPVEKDAASLTAEAVMRGSDAVPIALSVSYSHTSYKIIASHGIDFLILVSLAGKIDSQAKSGAVK